MITRSTDLKPCHKNQNCINKWTFNMQFMLNFAETWPEMSGNRGKMGQKYSFQSHNFWYFGKSKHNGQIISCKQLICTPLSILVYLSLCGDTLQHMNYVKGTRVLFSNKSNWYNIWEVTRAQRVETVFSKFTITVAFLSTATAILFVLATDFTGWELAISEEVGLPNEDSTFQPTLKVCSWPGCPSRWPWGRFQVVALVSPCRRGPVQIGPACCPDQNQGWTLEQDWCQPSKLGHSMVTWWRACPSPCCHPERGKKNEEEEDDGKEKPGEGGVDIHTG